jgi:hypothetical protein
LGVLSAVRKSRAHPTLRASPGKGRAGVVTFHRVTDDTTKVMLQMAFEPEGFVEKAGDVLGVVKARVKGDLGRFKEFIESRGVEEGGWRGEVDRVDGTGWPGSAVRPGRR